MSAARPSRPAGAAWFVQQVWISARAAVAEIAGHLQREFWLSLLACSAAAALYVLCWFMLLPGCFRFLETQIQTAEGVIPGLGAGYAATIQGLVGVMIVGPLTQSLRAALEKSAVLRVGYLRHRNSALVGWLLTLLGVAQLVGVHILLFPYLWAPVVQRLAIGPVLSVVTISGIVNLFSLAIALFCVWLNLRLDRVERGLAAKWALAILYYVLLGCVAALFTLDRFQDVARAFLRWFVHFALDPNPLVVLLAIVVWFGLIYVVIHGLLAREITRVGV